jgi:hypothetical protein
LFLTLNLPFAIGSAQSKALPIGVGLLSGRLRGPMNAKLCRRELAVVVFTNVEIVNLETPQPWEFFENPFLVAPDCVPTHLCLAPEAFKYRCI